VKRWPNRPHWQRTEATFREIAGRSWRTTAAKSGGVERKNLRARVDRSMTNDQIDKVDRVLIGSLKRHLRDLDERRERVANLILEVQRAGDERRRRVCEIEKPVFLEDVRERPLDELLAEYPPEYPPLLRAAWAELLSDERTAVKAA
jgi:hypothetical protein